MSTATMSRAQEIIQTAKDTEQSKLDKWEGILNDEVNGHAMPVDELLHTLAAIGIEPAQHIAEVEKRGQKYQWKKAAVELTAKLSEFPKVNADLAALIAQRDAFLAEITPKIEALNAKAIGLASIRTNRDALAEQYFQVATPKEKAGYMAAKDVFDVAARELREHRELMQQHQDRYPANGEGVGAFPAWDTEQKSLVSRLSELEAALDAAQVARNVARLAVALGG